MTFLIITALILIPTFLFLFIGGKVRDKFVFEKVGNEEIVDVNDAVKLLRRNEKKEYTSGVLYLTNRRLAFFKYRFNWLGIIQFIGEALYFRINQQQKTRHFNCIRSSRKNVRQSKCICAK